MRIKAQKITLENIGKFGKVIILSDNPPTSLAADYKFWSNLANYHIEGRTEIGICTVYRQPENRIEGMERHLKTPEILIPIDAPFVLPLLKEGDPRGSAEAFCVEQGQAVIIDAGVWHGACIPVGKAESSYFVIFRLNTPSEDVEKKQMEPLWVDF